MNKPKVKKIIGYTTSDGSMKFFGKGAKEKAEAEQVKINRRISFSDLMALARKILKVDDSNDEDNLSKSEEAFSYVASDCIGDIDDLEEFIRTLINVVSVAPDQVPRLVEEIINNEVIPPFQVVWSPKTKSAITYKEATDLENCSEA